MIAFDLTHGGMLRLGSNGRHHDQHRSHLESRMLGFIRTHWFLFVTAEIDEPAGRWEDAPMVVLGRALLLAQGAEEERALAQLAREANEGLQRRFNESGLSDMDSVRSDWSATSTGCTPR